MMIRLLLICILCAVPVLSRDSTISREEITQPADTVNADSLYAHIYFNDDSAFTEKPDTAGYSKNHSRRKVRSGLMMLILVGISLGLTQSNNPE
ncbi:MAG: hypothetical protein ACQEQV_02825 [Fibrobacterota bacterium]